MVPFKVQVYESVIEDFPQIPNSWHTSVRHGRTAATALDTLRHRSAGPLPSLAGATTHAPATDSTDPQARRNPLDQQRWAFDGSHCAGISAERVTTHVWLEAVLDELKGSRVQDPELQGQFMRQLIVSPLHSCTMSRLHVIIRYCTSMSDERYHTSFQVGGGSSRCFKGTRSPVPAHSIGKWAVPFQQQELHF